MHDPPADPSQHTGIAARGSDAEIDRLEARRRFYTHRASTADVNNARASGDKD